MPQRTDIVPEINDNMSPMMRQYIEIKRENLDSILFFRLGDFYEMFYNDARIASEELDLVLTGRASGEDERAPMCGIPYHSSESYISRLINKGYRVAICEQTEDPSKTKKLVKRGVIRIITPGTVTGESMLQTARNNYLCTAYMKDGKGSCCFVDVSTGELNLTTIISDTLGYDIINEFTRFAPKEILLNEELSEDKTVMGFLKGKSECRVEIMTNDDYCDDVKEQMTLNHFKVNSFSELDVDEIAKNTLCCALDFLAKTQKHDLSAINEIHIYSERQFMKLDLAARTNLELTKTIRGGNRKGTLLWVLDNTKTPMGKRLIHNWIEFPLISIAEITRRQNAVKELYSNITLRDNIGDLLRDIKDLERIITRITYKTANAKEIVALRETVGKMPALKSMTSECKCGLLQEINNNNIDELSDIYNLLFESIDDEPPITLREGKLIKRGYNEAIDECFRDMTDGKQIVRDIEERERERTGVKKLKVKYNRVFGYYIEVPSSATEFVPPEDYVRRQTLANAERYLTDEVRQLESRILGAQDRLYALEYELFCKIRDEVASHIERIRKTAVAIGQLDALYSLAVAAYENSYVCPQISPDGTIEIFGGRHPVVEKLSEQSFVPNDTLLDQKDNRCAIITGPNMAGKSTYMRQVAIITLMAHIGSFVPAQSAKIAITDAIYTRVGASDDLVMGQSTFMVEMSEVADILNNATVNSLLIIDEIGRGTSTYDGMAIARAVLEHIADKKKLGAKTLFATHYHELTVLEETMSGIKNYNIAAKKRGDEVIFLRKIIRGGADDSYGIEVAKLAGVPNVVVNRAKKILKSLVESSGEDYSKIARIESKEDDGQITFSDQQTDGIIRDLKTIDVNNLTPMEALKTIYELTEKAKNI